MSHRRQNQELLGMTFSCFDDIKNLIWPLGFGVTSSLVFSLFSEMPTPFYPPPPQNTQYFKGKKYVLLNEMLILL